MHLTRFTDLSLRVLDVPDVFTSFCVGDRDGTF